MPLFYILNLFSKITAIILTAHAYQQLKIILPNNPFLTFKVKPIQVLVLNSRMGYQLVSKTYPETLLKNH